MHSEIDQSLVRVVLPSLLQRSVARNSPSETDVVFSFGTGRNR